MSYSYLFKFIVIGDVSMLVALFRCGKNLSYDSISIENLHI